MDQKNKFLFGGSLTEDVLLEKNAPSKIMGALCFTSADEVAKAIHAELNLTTLHIPMQSLGRNKTICECWNSQDNAQQGNTGDIQYHFDDNALFGVINIDESAFDAIDNKTPLQQATESAYRQIFALIEQLNYPHIFRFWNYIADINTDSYALERYRQFNLGRHDAFVAFERAVVGNVPAACALGYSQSKSALLSIAFVAGRVEPVAIENPRQISAYRYPEQYGPASPTFSRASLVTLKQSELLLISGTASIVGHETQHTTDAVIQAKEAMMNIDAILAEANTVSEHAFTLQDLHYRVYVRYPEHLSDIQKEIAQYVGSLPKNIEYLRADICRLDLLLEIEATAEHSMNNVTKAV